MKFNPGNLPFVVALSFSTFMFSAAQAADVGTGDYFKGPIGLQLYSLRAQLATNVSGTLDEVKRWGVVNVELAGTYNLTPEQFKEQLDARGLNAVSGHFPYERLRDDAEGVAHDAEILGLKYVGCAWIPHDDNKPFDEKTMREAIAVFNQAGKALAKHGLKFFYHVHGYEFQPYQDGTLLDLLMRETNPKYVNFQMDVFWIVHPGQNPVALLKKYPKRWQLMHLKGMRDSTPTGLLTGHTDVTNDVALGTGKIDYAPILREARKVGVKWYFIEDESPSSEQQIPKSLNYLENVKWGKLGIFARQSDVGDVAQEGSAEYNPETGEYIIAGGGANIWSTADAFHFVWEKMAGDFTLTADIKFLGLGGNPHRKACLMVRQSLEPDTIYGDVAFHGNGLTALQYRETSGDTTHEIQSNISAPARVRLEKRGDYLSMWIESAGENLKLNGGYQRVPIKGEFYIGLGVCAHDNNTIERAVFSNVQLTPVSTPAAAQPALESTLETIAIDSTDRSVVYHTSDHIEAPNWSRDGSYFLFNSGGRIYKLPVTNGAPEAIDTGKQIRCNNDHGISPDGSLLAISDQSEPDGKSHIYILPITGGAPRQVTLDGPSYWHGWSPDGRTLAYCAERNGQFDIYTIPVDNIHETRLTSAPGLNDGPDYSPDGQYIYFNSERDGSMQIWRMKPDGSEPEQITSDDYNNWFAHPSPDGKWIVFLTYGKSVVGHPANQDVMLRLMNLSDKKIRVLAKLFGGQGTINVPSWSPDSKNVAFVSYQLVYP
ncbi:MAG TPA: TIM barrel protein [Verrucomicrobiae bacterium]|nr:TIM barrel protein [Verrucomicrobiae bacterium]